jgi:hypothetical protein
MFACLITACFVLFILGLAGICVVGVKVRSIIFDSRKAPHSLFVAGAACVFTMYASVAAFGVVCVLRLFGAL